MTGETITLGQVRAAIENVETIVAMRNPSAQFLEEFAERRRAIGRAVIAEQGADSQAAASGNEEEQRRLAEVSHRLSESSSNHITLGPASRQHFEELVAWLAQRGLYSISG
jgi:hypothetical protein